ncbi:MAG: MaoC family dehydratase [Acidimicrobiales bacterium]
MADAHRPVTTQFVAIEDPPEIQRVNPIHAEGAKAYGYERPIVAGLSSYGWATLAVIELLGDAWLDLGWAEMRFRRPVFAGDALTTTATPTGEATCEFVQVNAEGKATVEGAAGLGLGPWHAEWRLPARRDPVPAAEHRPFVLPENAPVDEDYPPMAVDLSVEAARRWAGGRLGDFDPRWHAGEHPRAHPSFVPGQMAPHIRHSWRFAAGIHVSGRVQHLEPIRAGQTLVVAARWVANEERKARRHSTSHAVVLAESGQELAYCAEERILLPPPPR